LRSATSGFRLMPGTDFRDSRDEKRLLHELAPYF
jgi:hypothetical protein